MTTFDYYVITGIDAGKKPDNAKIPSRMDVDVWYASKEDIHVNQRALFFPAFEKFQQADPTSKLSYFQIAGIHGQPYVPWDEPWDTKPAGKGKGYCTHNSMLFGTWHRPYLMLWEQVIHNLMGEVLKTFSEKEWPQLQIALDQWRFPYWDWALKKTAYDKTIDYDIPLVLYDKNVLILKPDSTSNKDLKPMPNPLYRFGMSNGITMGDKSLDRSAEKMADFRLKPVRVVDRSQGIDATIDYGACKATSRCIKDSEVNQNFIDGVQNNELIAQGLRSEDPDPNNNPWVVRDITVVGGKKVYSGKMTSSLKAAFYRLFAVEKFEDFVTKRVDAVYNAGGDHMKEYGSCENIHDDMHGVCGGAMVMVNHTQTQVGPAMQGHMSHVPVAAFDPIFWLHHCNVDRQLAIWQFLHEEAWFDISDKREVDGGTFAIPAGTVDKPTDELKPFHKDANGKCYTSDDVRYIQDLGYTYPLLDKTPFIENGVYVKQKHLAYVRKELNKNYNGDERAARLSLRTPAERRPIESAILQEVEKPETFEDFQIDDYVVNIIYEKFALGGAPFLIHVFVGKPPDSAPYTQEDLYFRVGNVYNFAAEPGSFGTSDEGCINCHQQAKDHLKSSGKVVLTNALITRWKQQINHGGNTPLLGSITPDQVIPFLQEHLHWRVTDMYGQVLDISDRLSSLRVMFAAGKANHYAELEKMSEYRDYRPVYSVTAGKSGGAVEADNLL